MNGNRRTQRWGVAMALASVLVVAVSGVALAAHAVRHHGTGHIKGTWSVNFDGGVFNASSGRDMYFDVVKDNQRYLDPVNGSSIKKIGATRPTYSQCRNAALVTTSYNVASVALGTWFCFKTPPGRFVRFRLDHVDPYPGGIDLTYTTWEF